MERILITGASGFVGRVLVQRALEAGHDVTAALRTSATPSEHPRLRLETVGEIDEQTDWRSALDGVTSIIHTAGRVHIMRDRARSPLREFRRVNTDGTRRLANCAAHAGVRRLVYVSSIKVNGEQTDHTSAFCDTDAPAPGDPYGISKWEAEQALSEIGARTGLETVVVRPPLVFGAGVRANFLGLLRWIDRGLPLPLGAIDNRRSLVSVWNLADLLLACTQKVAAAGQLFLAADARTVSTRDLARMIARALDRPVRLLPFAPTLLEAAARILGKREQVRRLCSSLVVDASKAHRLLGWYPALSLEEGLAKTVHWYRGEQRSSLARAP